MSNEILSNKIIEKNNENKKCIAYQCKSSKEKSRKESTKDIKRMNKKQ